MNDTTWQARMRAVAAGSCKRNEAEKLLIECAAIADKALAADRPRREAEAKARGKMDGTPSWHFVVSVYWRALGNGRKLGAKCPEDIANELITMGEVADEWLASQEAQQ